MILGPVAFFPLSPEFGFSASPLHFVAVTFEPCQTMNNTATYGCMCGACVLVAVERHKHHAVDKDFWLNVDPD